MNNSFSSSLVGSNLPDYPDKISAGFTYKIDRMKSMASKFRGPPAKVYNIFDAAFGLSYLCCNNALYSLNNTYTPFQNIAEF